MDQLQATKSFPCRHKSDGKPCTESFVSAKARGRHEREQHTRLLPGMAIRKMMDGTKVYFAKIRLADGQWHERTFGTNKAVAMKAYEEMKADARRQKNGLHVAQPFSAVVQLFKELCFGRLSTGTQRSYSGSYKCFAQWARLKLGLAPEQIKNIRVQDAEAYREWLLSRGVAPNSVNLKLVQLGLLMKWAIERGFAADPNPFARCKRVKVGQRHPEWLREHELAAVINRCRLLDEKSRSNNSLADIVTLLAYTGVRPTELTRNIRWEDVDLAEGVVHVRSRRDQATKTRCDRTIPLAPQAMEVFVRMKAGRNAPTGNLFTLGRATIRVRLANIYRDLGYKAKNVYTLRHTCASLLIRSGVPLEVVQKIMGHADIKMTLRYAHVANESMREAVNKLGAFMQKASAEPTGALKKA